MESYSHGAFQVSGYTVSITDMETMMQSIQDAWGKFMSEALGDVVEHKAYPQMHCIYYNFVDPTGPRLGYDMLIGYVTTDGAVQSDPRITTITIPPQNYKYKEVTGNPQEVLGKLWKEINALPKSEVDRKYGYDMEMYGEDGKITVAVSVV
ncbi:MAG: effector binding domain-containing protein [Minisyncoccia bacterium]